MEDVAIKLNRQQAGYLLSMLDYAASSWLTHSGNRDIEGQVLFAAVKEQLPEQYR